MNVLLNLRNVTSERRIKICMPDSLWEDDAFLSVRRETATF